jgi:hypothetical protein
VDRRSTNSPELEGGFQTCIHLLHERRGHNANDAPSALARSMRSCIGSVVARCKVRVNHYEDHIVHSLVVSITLDNEAGRIFDPVKSVNGRVASTMSSRLNVMAFGELRNRCIRPLPDRSSQHRAVAMTLWACCPVQPT